MEYCICNECVKHKSLKRIIEDKGKTQRCSFCEKTNKAINISESNDFKLLVKALIRFYYSESDYNRWVGGVDVEEIFKKENKLFNFIIPKEIECEYDEKYKKIVPNCDDYGKGVSLYYREASGERGWFFTPLKDETNNIEIMTRDYNPYMIARIITNKIKKHARKLLLKTDGGEVFYRARIGIDKEMYEEAEYPELMEKKFLPYRGAHISAPKPSIATEGRLNRKGTAFLYLASDEKTTISEVKPNKGHMISIAKFQVKKELNIANFKDIDIYNFHNSDDDIEDFVFIRTLAQKLSLPSSEQRYDFTQAITDSLIAIGFDGLIFNSSLTTGYNLVLFSSEDANYIKCSSKVVNIRAVQYEYENVNSNIISNKFYTWGNNEENRGGALGEELIEKV